MKFQDFDALSDWVATLSEMHNVSFAISWALSKKTCVSAAKAQRKAAVADAIDHAGDYAGALGLSTPSLLPIFEPGLRPAKGGGREGMIGASFARSAGSAGSKGRSFDLQPADILVEASITADFTV